MLITFFYSYIESLLNFNKYFFSTNEHLLTVHKYLFNKNYI